MLGPDVRMHRLRGNASERSPWDCLFIDTEAFIEAEGHDELHTLRLWTATHVRRHTGTGWPLRDEWEWGRDADALADVLERACTTRHPLWVFTHNLSYDLTITRLPLALLARGWELKKHALASDTPWAHLQRGGCSIWLCDSYSWLRKSLEDVGAALDMWKPPLPTYMDAEADWCRRCLCDTAILRAAMLQLMAWWDAGKLGHWSFTGPQTGWNALRHMCVRSGNEAYSKARQRALDEGGEVMPGRMVICDEPDIRAFEREAMYQGMREVGRVGWLSPGAWANLDLVRAHLRVVRHMRLPCRVADRGDTLPLDSVWLRSVHHDIIGECLIRTAEPRYPVRMGGHIEHPVGELRTVLCGPEIRRAKERGELVSIGRWQGYELNRFGSPWAAWIEEVLDGTDEETPPAARIAAKAWSRTVVGKWGARTSRSQVLGQAQAEWGWEVAPAPATRPDLGSLILIGDRWEEVYRDLEGDNAFPAVLAFIQSWVRLQLLDAIAAAGPEYVVQCNTDGMVIDAVGAGMVLAGDAEDGLGHPATWQGVAHCCETITEVLEGAEVAVKGLYRMGWVLSPQHLVLDGYRRLSGIPSQVEKQTGWRFTFHSWPKMKGQIRNGDERGYMRRKMEVDLSGVPVARWVMGCGCAMPVEVRQDEQGHNELVSPAGMVCTRHGVALRAEQAPWLVRLLPTG